MQVPFLFGVPAFEKAANWVIHLIFRRTGRHLFLNDDDEGKPPLLKRMIKDYGDCYFMYALAPLFLCGYLEWYQVSWDAPISQSEYVINRMTTKLFMQVCVAYIQTSGGIFKCGLWPYPVFTVHVALVDLYFWRFLLNLPLLFPIMNHYKDIVGWRTSSIRRNSDLPKVMLSAWILFLWLGTGPSDCNLINKASFWYSVGGFS